MRLSNDARLPQDDTMPGLKRRLVEIVRDIVNQVNFLSEGSIRASTSAMAAPPATGSYTTGDFVRNSAPQELGAAGSKYVVTGWLCVAAPTTFVQQRCLTGN